MIFHDKATPFRKKSLQNCSNQAFSAQKAGNCLDFESILNNFSKKISQKIQTLSQKIDNLQLFSQKHQENPAKIPKISGILQENAAKSVPPILEQKSNLFISNIQKNSVFFSIFNKHFTNIYTFLQELSETNYEFLYRNLIDILNEFLVNSNNFPDNFSENSSLPSFPSFPDIFKKKEESHARFLKENARFSDNNEKSDNFGGSSPENNCENSNFEAFFRKNSNSRKKWGPSFLNTGKIPRPLYELFKKQRFSYKVMPSLKEKYQENLSMKDVKPNKIEEKKRENANIPQNSNENQENSQGNSPKTQLNIEKNQEICKNTGGDCLNLFTNFKARMSRKYKK